MMLDWLQSMTNAIVSVVIGTLAFIGLGAPSLPVQNLESPSVVSENKNEVTNSSSEDATNKKEEVNSNIKSTTNKPSMEVTEDKQIKLEPAAPTFEILFQPQKSQYTSEEVQKLNAEAISYFKIHSTCNGLGGFGLSYCQAFEALPEIQIWKATLQHNAEVEARNSASTTTNGD